MATTSDKIRLIIADDHPLLRQGLRQIIERETVLEVVGEAGDGEAALAGILSAQPDIVVLDLDMPKANGFDVLRALREKQSRTKAIMLTVHDEEEFFGEALRLGAQGYVLKDIATEEIVEAVRHVAADRNYVSPALNAYLFRQHKHDSDPDLPSLTPTERQILKLIAEYKTNKEIAAALFVSPFTVKTHRRNICVKLDLEGNHALMRFALEHKSHL